MIDRGMPDMLRPLESLIAEHAKGHQLAIQSRDRIVRSLRTEMAGMRSLLLVVGGEVERAAELNQKMARAFSGSTSEDLAELGREQFRLLAEAQRTITADAELIKAPEATASAASRDGAGTVGQPRISTEDVDVADWHPRDPVALRGVELGLGNMDANAQSSPPASTVVGSTGLASTSTSPFGQASTSPSASATQKAPLTSTPDPKLSCVFVSEPFPASEAVAKANELGVQLNRVKAEPSWTFIETSNASRAQTLQQSLVVQGRRARLEQLRTPKTRASGGHASSDDEDTSAPRATASSGNLFAVGRAAPIGGGRKPPTTKVKQAVEEPQTRTCACGREWCEECGEWCPEEEQPHDVDDEYWWAPEWHGEAEGWYSGEYGDDQQDQDVDQTGQ